MVKDWIVGLKDKDTSNVLVTEGDWTLERIEHYNDFSSGRGGYRYVSLIKHMCYPKKELATPSGIIYQVVVYPEETNKCWRCKVVIPDKMVVLWHFQNWDNIQRRRGQN